MGLPVLDLPAYYAWIDRMKRDRRSLVTNDENWGLALEKLSEVDPTRSTAGHSHAEKLETARGGV